VTQNDKELLLNSLKIEKCKKYEKDSLNNILFSESKSNANSNNITSNFSKFNTKNTTTTKIRKNMRNSRSEISFHSPLTNIKHSTSSYLPRKKNLMKILSFEENEANKDKVLEDKDNFLDDIINKFKKKRNNKIKIKHLECDLKLHEDAIRNDSLRKNSDLFLTNPTSSFRRLDKRHSTKKTKFSFILENHDYDNKNSIIKKENNMDEIFLRNMNRPKEKDFKEMIFRNINIVEKNKTLKILCYKVPLEKDLQVNDIISTDITRNYQMMTQNKSRYKCIQNEESYRRVKDLESKLPYVMKHNNFITRKPKVVVENTSFLNNKDELKNRKEFIFRKGKHNI